MEMQMPIATAFPWLSLLVGLPALAALALGVFPSLRNYAR